MREKAGRPVEVRFADGKGSFRDPLFSVAVDYDCFDNQPEKFSV